MNALIGLAIISAFAVVMALLIRRAIRRQSQRARECACDDPVNDPEVQAMLKEVIRTGRPMHMVRGEAPTFVDRPSSRSKEGA